MGLVNERNYKGGLASPKIVGGAGKFAFYKFYRGNKGTLLRDSFSKVLREVNFALVDEILESAEDFTLPFGIGRISFRKRKNRAYIGKDGVLSNSLVDWKKTMDLWESNPEAAKKRIRIKYTNMETGRYSFRVSMFGRTFKNKEYFAFVFKRSLKRKFAKRIKEYNKPKIEVEITKHI